jgi:hypothetical protein
MTSDSRALFELKAEERARERVAQHERAIASLIDGTSVAPDEVRKLFADELAQLETHAKVRTHLLALTTSKVRGLLRKADASRPR